MQLPRWNNCKNPRTRGKTAQPSISHSGQGLEGKKSSSLPVEGGIFSLTFPFIDQIDPWLTRTTAGLAQFQRLIGVVATNKDAAAEMEQLQEPKDKGQDSTTEHLA